MGGSSGGKSITKHKGWLGWWERLKQQETWSWSPKYRASGVSPLFIGFGILLVPLGVAVLIISTDSSSEMKKKIVDYTDCKAVNENVSSTCAEYIRSPAGWTGNESNICKCEVEFELEKPIKGKKIYMYYALKNFHQNVRQYAASRDDDQLLGKLGTAAEPNDPAKNCEPLDKDPDGKIYYPCGSLANSMFNDSIQLYLLNNEKEPEMIPQERKGIAWATDLKFRYKNPPEFNDRNHSIWQKFTKPRDWDRSLWDLDPDNPDNNGVQNEDFTVWMRPAAFADFQKLYRIIKPADENLPAGRYLLKINYTYEVASFKGIKQIVIASTTFFGQQNYFQGISMISVGGFCLFVGLLFLLGVCNKRHRKGLMKSRSRTYSKTHGL